MPNHENPAEFSLWVPATHPTLQTTGMGTLVSSQYQLYEPTHVTWAPLPTLSDPLRMTERPDY